MKKPFPVKPQTPARAQQQLHPQNQPSHLRVMQPKTVTASRGPVAPPVYRPQPTPKVLQTKAATTTQPQRGIPAQRTPVAPPVYRPQPTPKALQAKMPSASMPKDLHQNKAALTVDVSRRVGDKAPVVPARPKPAVAAPQLKRQSTLQMKGGKRVLPKGQKLPRIDMTLVGQGTDYDLNKEQDFEFYTAQEMENIRIEADATGRVMVDADNHVAMPDGEYMFLMDKHGNIFLHPEVPGMRGKKVHHSSLSIGKRPSGAGEIHVKAGKIVLLSNESGHYMPTEDDTVLVQQQLNAQGFDTKSMQIKIKTPQVPPYRVPKDQLTVRKLAGYETKI